MLHSRTCQRSVDDREEAVVVPRPRHETGLVEHEGGDAGRRGAQGRVHDGSDHGDAVLGVGDAAL